MQMPQPIARTQSSYRDAHLSIDFDRQTVTVDSKPLRFTRKEYELLSFLVVHAGELIPRESLLTSVWGYNSGVRTRTLDMHLSLLRKKLHPYSGQYLERVFRMGCRFQPCAAAPATNAA